MPPIKHWLKNHAYQNIPLTFDEAMELGEYAILGCGGDPLAQIQSIAILCALHTQATYAWRWTTEAENRHGHPLPSTAAEQIAGVCAAIFQADIAHSEYGFLHPNLKVVMDNCGMGGDLRVTANISSIAAFIAAAAGIAICKHGSPANADSGRHGSSDFMELIGIHTYADKATVLHCLEQENFAYTEALDTRYKLIHLQTHKIAQLPHMNDIIGPITNPVDPRLLTHRVLGVNHLMSPRLVAEAYQIMNRRGITNLQHGLFVRGFISPHSNEGVDELSVCPGGTQVAELRDGTIRGYRLYAEDFDIEPIDPASISPPKGMSKGDFSLGILRQEITGPVIKMVLANAALLFYLADPSRSWPEAYHLAQTVYASGMAYTKALAVKQLTRATMGVMT